VTPAEQERLEKEKVQLAKMVDELVLQYQATVSKILVGDGVVEKAKPKVKRFGVVVETIDNDTVAVRWESGSGANDPANNPIVRGVKISTLALANYNFFLSHAQAEAQNQVAHLSVLLRDKGAQVWFDMDSERLEARGGVLFHFFGFFCLHLYTDAFHSPLPVLNTFN